MLSITNKFLEKVRVNKLVDLNFKNILNQLNIDKAKAFYMGVDDIFRFRNKISMGVDDILRFRNKRCVSTPNFVRTKKLKKI